MSVFDRQHSDDASWRGLGSMAERVNSIIRAMAHPSLTQLVLRFALAVPFWRSGVKKWDGFLALNDVAVLLFSSEFKLHLPGGPYPFPAPEVMAFRRRLSRNPAAHTPGSRVGDAIGGAGASGDDTRCAAYRAGRLADPSDLGGNGARHHGVGAGADFARSMDWAA